MIRTDEQGQSRPAIRGVRAQNSQAGAAAAAVHGGSLRVQQGNASSPRSKSPSSLDNNTASAEPSSRAAQTGTTAEAAYRGSLRRAQRKSASSSSSELSSSSENNSTSRAGSRASLKASSPKKDTTEKTSAVAVRTRPSTSVSRYQEPSNLRLTSLPESTPSRHPFSLSPCPKTSTLPTLSDKPKDPDGAHKTQALSSTLTRNQTSGSADFRSDKSTGLPFNATGDASVTKRFRDWSDKASAADGNDIDFVDPLMGDILYEGFEMEDYSFPEQTGSRAAVIGPSTAARDAAMADATLDDSFSGSAFLDDATPNAAVMERTSQKNSSEDRAASDRAARHQIVRSSGTVKVVTVASRQLSLPSTVEDRSQTAQDKLTDDEISRIRQLLQDPDYSAERIATAMGYTRTTLYRRWESTTGEPFKTKCPIEGPPKAPEATFKLSYHEITRIQSLLSRGKPWYEIAKIFNQPVDVLQWRWDITTGGDGPEVRRGNFRPPTPLSEEEISDIRTYFADESNKRRTWKKMAHRLGISADALRRRWDRETGVLPVGCVKYPRSKRRPT